MSIDTEDSEFLQWVYDRLVIVHGENKHTDYMQKLLLKKAMDL